MIEKSSWVPPAPDMDYEKRVQGTARTLVRERMVSSAQAILAKAGLPSRFGGECSFGSLRSVPTWNWIATCLRNSRFFSHEGPLEDFGRTENPELRECLEAEKERRALKIGVTVSGILRIGKSNSVLITEASIERLFEPWSEYLLRFGAAVLSAVNTSMLNAEEDGLHLTNFTKNVEFSPYKGIPKRPTLFILGFCTLSNIEARRECCWKSLPATAGRSITFARWVTPPTYSLPTS